MRRSRTLPAVAAIALLITLSSAGPAAVRADSCGADSATLLDGGFEAPVIAPVSFVQIDSSLVPPWKTTDSQNEIEIWSTGFNGVPSNEGNQFAELNANTPGTLYQDVVTTAGEHMTWTLAHRGRSGTDTMKVLIGDATTADVNSDTGWNYFSSDLIDDNTAWGTHTADYVVPAGQVCTRFAFRAVSAAGGNPSIGNFLDAVGFQVSVPPTPTPRPTARPTPPVTDTLGAEPPVNLGASLLVLSLLFGLSAICLGLAINRRRA